jgi:hypothetical protein
VFERLQHSAGHLAVVAAVNPEIDTGLRDLQFVKEDPRQRRIVVLAGVNQNLAEVVASGDSSRNARRLDKLRASADDRKNT